MDSLVQGLFTFVDKNDAKKTVQVIIRKYGYPQERHFYETEDGHIN